MDFTYSSLREAQGVKALEKRRVFEMDIFWLVLFVVALLGLFYVFAWSVDKTIKHYIDHAKKK